MNKLLERSRELFLRYGIRNITMDKLSADLGISKKTLYQTIPNKSFLIEQIIKAFIKEQQEEIQLISINTENAVEEMYQMTTMAIKHIRMLPPNLTYELQKYYPECWSHVEKHHKGFLLEVIKQNLKRGQEEQIYRAEFNTDLVSILYASKIDVVVKESGYQTMGYSQEDIFKEFILYHLHGIASEKGRTLIHNYFNF